MRVFTLTPMLAPNMHTGIESIHLTKHQGVCIYRVASLFYVSR